eukprot:6316693-Prymnesium_polylepis.1
MKALLFERAETEGAVLAQPTFGIRPEDGQELVVRLLVRCRQASSPILTQRAGVLGHRSDCFAWRELRELRSGGEDALSVMEDDRPAEARRLFVFTPPGEQHLVAMDRVD